MSITPAPPPIRLPLPGGFYFEHAAGWANVWLLYGPDGNARLELSWSDADARAFDAALTRVPEGIEAENEELRRLFKEVNEHALKCQNRAHRAEAALAQPRPVVPEELRRFIVAPDRDNLLDAGSRAAKRKAANAALAYVRSLIDREAASPPPPAERQHVGKCEMVFGWTHPAPHASPPVNITDSRTMQITSEGIAPARAVAGTEAALREALERMILEGEGGPSYRPSRYAYEQAKDALASTPGRTEGDARG